MKILALHGFLGRGSDWAAVRAASRAPLEWVCPDLFAPGGTGVPRVPASAAKLELLASSCGPGRAWLAGYSLGARLALNLLAADPDRWLGALLVSCNPGNFQNDEERAARRRADIEWARAFRTEPWDEVLLRWNGQGVFGDAPPPRREECDFSRDALAGALEDFSAAVQFTDPARLAGPLVWMAGADDAKFAALLVAMPNAGFPGTFLAVPRAGHRLLHEAPDEVAAGLDRLTA